MGDWQRCSRELFLLIVVPVLYQGLLSISYMIHDPFGEDMLDFPVAAYTEYVSQSCAAVITAQRSFPESVLAQVRKVAQAKQEPPKPAKKEPEPNPNLTHEAIAESLKKIAYSVDCLPHVAAQIEALQGAAAASERQRSEDWEKLRQTLTAQAQAVPLSS